MPSKDTQFKPGNNANPKGRPKKEVCLTDILREQAELEDVKTEDGILISRKQGIGQKLWAMAMGGDTVIMKYLYDRIDGKPRQSIDMVVNDAEPDLSNLTEKETMRLAELNRKARS